MMISRLLRASARVIAPLLLIGALSACGGSRIEPGIYRAVLTVPGGELPFGLELAQENATWVAYLINGERHVRVTDVTVDGRKVEMTMPGYINRLSARMRDKQLEGEVVLVKRGGKEYEIPFVATPGEQHRFYKEPLTDNADLSGRWAVTFTGTDGKRTPAVAEFRQKFSEVTGTFMTETGDYGDLAGEVRDDELYLSTFDGGRAYLFRAKLTPTDELRGTWWSGISSREEFVARRDANAALRDPDSIMRIRDDTWALGFTFPDEEGRAVSMADARFRGKVVVLTLLGSWCPNTHDAMAFLTPLYREQRGHGVEVVALMFEDFDDFAPAAQAVKALRKKYAAEYPTLIAGVSEKARAAELLPQLSHVHAFPTFLFLDRRGRVRRIYTGFTGPATGAHYEELIRSLQETVEKLATEGV
jgi:thiol-disulfide isomerase/thioredoxin